MKIFCPLLVHRKFPSLAQISLGLGFPLNLFPKGCFIDVEDQIQKLHLEPSKSFNDYLPRGFFFFL